MIQMIEIITTRGAGKTSAQMRGEMTGLYPARASVKSGGRRLPTKAGGNGAPRNRR